MERQPEAGANIIPAGGEVIARMRKREEAVGAVAEIVMDRLRSFGLWPGPGASTWRPTTSPPSAWASSESVNIAAQSAAGLSV